MTLIRNILLLKKWYIINDENNTNYGVNKDTGANNPDTIKYDTRVLKPNLCDYADAYILVDGTIRAEGANAATRLALKNCAPFTKCNLEVNDEHVDTAENLDIVMSMYNLIEYSDNYQDSSATPYQYKRDEPPDDIDNNLAVNNSSSFKYKVNLLGNPVVYEPRFNGVYSRNNLPKKVKKGAYVINLDEYENTGTHWIALFVKTNKFILIVLA